MKTEKIKIHQNIISTDQFGKEADLQSFIIENIKAFCENVLGDNLVSFEAEKSINKRPCFSSRGRRVDLYIQGQKKIYIIELKNPRFLAENRYGIGQLLDYGREFLDSKKELVLVTTKFDINTAKTISHYRLPIRYVYLDKDNFIEPEHGD